MNVVEITQSLVRIPSVNPVYDANSPGTPAMIEWITRWAEENGFEVERLAVHPTLDNLVLRLRNGEGPHFLFNGHLDTVSIAGMTIEPFSGEIRDGKLWGRGSCDMKGSIAAMLVAAQRLKARSSEWSGTLTLGFTCDEETGTQGIRALIQQIPRPDAAIVGEPSRLNPIRGCKGSVRLTLTAHGRAAHSSRPHLGRSAISAMAKGILALNQYFDTELKAIHRPQFDSCTGSIGLIKGGAGVNIVPERCKISIDIRLVPGRDAQTAFDHLESWFHQHVQEEGIRWEFEALHLDPAFEIAPEHPLTQTVCELTGWEGTPDVAFFCCDASKLADAGIPCLILGPGDIAQAHTAAEYIEVEQLERGVKVYEALALRLLGKA